jgi:hypothetical protein
MARLIDDVLSGNTRYVYPDWIENDYKVLYPDTSSRGHQVFKESLRQCTVFDITNVSDYFYAGTDQEFWDVGLDFPCPMPPFDGIWMEYNKPKTVVSRDPQTNPVDFIQNFPSRCGCLVYCTGLRDNRDQMTVHEYHMFDQIDQFRAAALAITKQNAGVRCADAYYELKYGRRVKPEEGFPRKFLP